MEGLKEIFTNRTYPRKSFPRSPWTTTVACVTFLWLCHFTFSRFYIEPKQVSYGHKRALDDLTKVKVTVLDFNRRVIEADDGVKTSLALNHVAAGKISRNDFGTWLNEQEVISWENMLRNIADTNLNNDLASKRGVAEGAVVASPSTSDPDYFYQWTRDSAITIGTVVKTLLDDANVNITVFGSVFKYIENSRKLQRVTNPSGNFNDLSGLGEAKFMVDNTAFQGAWGRPQNDGPALRIMTISSFLKALRKHQLDVPKALEAYRSKYGENSLPVAFRNEQEIFDQVINYDVRFVMDRWSEDNFDLWEEVKGRHFFTTLCQLKALKLTLNDLTLGVFNTDDSFVNELKNRINEITHFLTSDGGFLNPNLNFVVETPSVLGGRSGLDIATVIASILTHDEIPGEDTSSVSIPFDVDSPAVLNVLYEIAKKMSTLYPINHQVPSNMGVALGRYPEDIYNGHGTSEGNPWFLATSYAAELIYKFIAHHYHQKKDIVIAVSQDKSMSAFWNSILDGLGNLRDNASEVNIPYDSPAFHQTMDTLFSYGDSFLDIERQHVTDQGEMSEQFNKYTGFSQGASNLTWSYGAFLSSVRWRNIAQEAVQKKD